MFLIVATQCVLILAVSYVPSSLSQTNFLFSFYLAHVSYSLL